MTDMHAFEKSVQNYEKALRAIITTASDCRALETVERVTAYLAEALHASEKIRADHELSTDQEKLIGFAVVIGGQAQDMNHYRQVRGDLYAPDTKHNSFSAQDILAYHGYVPYDRN